MDGGNTSTCEVVVKTAKVMKKGTVKRSKNPNPKFYKYLLECLDEESPRHHHMLRYVSDSKNEFEVIFTDRKNKKIWKRSDISLFIDSDKHLESKFNRKRSEVNYEENVKIRFKSNLWKCEGKYIEKIKETKIGKSKTIKTYRIKWRPPSAGESSNSGRNKRKSKKNDKSSDNKEIDVKESNKNAILDIDNETLKSSHEIVYFLNKAEDEKSKIKLNVNGAFQEKEEKAHSGNKSHYLCLTVNSKMEIGGNVHMDYDANLENLKIVNSGEMEIDGNVHMDYEANLENFKFFNSAEVTQKINDFQNTLDCHDNMEIERNVYVDYEVNLDNLKNLNFTEMNNDKDNVITQKISDFQSTLDCHDSVEIDGNMHVDYEVNLNSLKFFNFAEMNNDRDNVNNFVSNGDLNDLVKLATTSCGNLGNHMNVSHGNLYCDPNFIIDVSSQDINYFNGEMESFSKKMDAYTDTEFGGGENISEGKYLIDEIEPKQNVENEKFLCSLPFWAVSNSLGDYNDWSNNYQNLKSMEHHL